MSTRPFPFLIFPSNYKESTACFIKQCTGPTSISQLISIVENQSWVRGRGVILLGGESLLRRKEQVMGRGKYKASLSTAGGLYVFSPAGACPTMSCSSIACFGCATMGHLPQSNSRRLRVELIKCEECGEKCTCTGDLKQRRRNE